MELVAVISSGITVAVVSGVIGKVLGSHDKVKEKMCGERRESCVALIAEKVDHLTSKVDYLTDVIKNGRKST